MGGARTTGGVVEVVEGEVESRSVVMTGGG